jgi:hypothetical protein
MAWFDFDSFSEKGIVTMNKEERKRIVESPQVGVSGFSGEVLSVELGDHEDIIWHWTHEPGGGSFVTGYEICEQSEKSEGGRGNGSTRNDRD